MRDRSPNLGGGFALWSGTFALISGYFKHYRGVEDEWNETLGGGFTAFFIYLRSGGFMYAINQGAQVGFIFFLMERMYF